MPFFEEKQNIFPFIQVDFARYLLAHGATVGHLDATGEFNFEFFDHLICLFPPPVSGSVFPLMLAAESGELEVCRLLVEEWAAEVNQQAIDGTTPLMSASSEGRLDVGGLKKLGNRNFIINFVSHFSDLSHRSWRRNPTCERRRIQLADARGEERQDRSGTPFADQWREH